MLAQMKIAWHYTTGENALLIFESGELRPTSSYIEPGEKPILWFSKTQYWEETANKMLRLDDGSLRKLTMKETYERGEGLFRFGLPSERATNWPKIASLAGMRSKIRQNLEIAGMRDGADFREWCGLLEPVSIFTLYGQKMNADLEWVNL